VSERSHRISKLRNSRDSRASYIKTKLSVLVPAQLRALRLKSEAPRQEDLASLAGMKQSRISAMETPGAVNFNLETLVRLAATHKVGLVVKFVSFSEMLRWENSFSQDSFDVVNLERDVEFIQGGQSTSLQYFGDVVVASTPVFSHLDTINVTASLGLNNIPTIQTKDQLISDSIGERLASAALGMVGTGHLSSQVFQ